MRRQRGYHKNLKDLEMAKKRNHKIMITDHAIKKVPRVEYKHIPESEYDTIRTLARQVLQLSKEENNSNEIVLEDDYQGILSERLEDQLKAVEWVKQEYARIQQEKADRLSIELMEKMRPVIIERRERAEV